MPKESKCRKNDPILSRNNFLVWKNFRSHLALFKDISRFKNEPVWKKDIIKIISSMNNENQITILIGDLKHVITEMCPTLWKWIAPRLTLGSNWSNVLELKLNCI